MNVDINVLKKLREITQAPLKDCKEVLIESNGDIDKSIRLLKEKGLAKAAKKADRETNEGVIRVKSFGNIVIGVKLACETDFVAKNGGFIGFADELVDIIKTKGMNHGSISELSEEFIEKDINPMIAEKVGSIGENIKLLDTFYLEGKHYVYNHMNMNKIVTIVFYEQGDEEVAKDIALQVTAMNPEYINIESIPESVIEEITENFKKEMNGVNKPVDILNNIIEGKKKKMFEEIVLTEQLFIKDDTKKVKHIMPQGFKINNYLRYSV